MYTFVKCAEVFRIGMPQWSLKKRRMWLKLALERYIELNNGYYNKNDVLYEEILGI